MTTPHFEEHATACEICDWVNDIPKIPSGQRLRCERCGHVLVTVHRSVISQLWMNSVFALLMFGFSLKFVFLGFSANGAHQKISLFDCVLALISQHHLALGIVVMITLIILPLFYLSSALLLTFAIKLNIRMSRRHYWLMHSLTALKPWLMVDVFFLGTLVALVKLHSLADIELGPSFWAFCCYNFFLLRTMTFIDKRWMWNHLCGSSPSIENHCGTASAQGLKGCPQCGALVNQSEQQCPRCYHVVTTRKHDSLNKTYALLLAACILYIPANYFPIMNTTFLGATEPSTIIGGVMLLWGMKSYPVALVILIASVVVPVAKILALIWLSKQTQHGARVTKTQANHIYHLTEFVGRWSMVDVFVVAILSSLVQLGSLMSIIPGPAALSFAAVVILTMLAAMSFDSRLIWDRTQENEH